jgi:hypothetical protein
MTKNSLELKFEFERYVKLICDSRQCANNLADQVGMFCNLKRIEIGSDGMCLDQCVPESERPVVDV